MENKKRLIAVGKRMRWHYLEVGEVIRHTDQVMIDKKWRKIGGNKYGPVGMTVTDGICCPVGYYRRRVGDTKTA